MRKQALIKSLNADFEESEKKTVIQKLKAFMGDAEVVRALCVYALQTDSHPLRVAIIDALRGIDNLVNPFFTHMAMNAKCETLRKWALVNLSLMGCKSAKEAVIYGLQDPSGSVQQAAALNIGLYRDHDFLQEVKAFFERNSLDCFTFKYGFRTGRVHSA